MALEVAVALDYIHVQGQAKSLREALDGDFLHLASQYEIHEGA